MRVSRKASLAIAAATFFVLAGTGVASALWSTPASVSSTVRVADLTDNCTTGGQILIENASFEEPDTGSRAGVTQVRGTGNPASGGMPGWQSKNRANVVTDIEIWRNGTTYNGLPAVATTAGKQFVELNANEPGTLFQNVKTEQAGQTLQWSLLHRGRLGKDSMQLMIGSPTSPVVQRTITTDNGVADKSSGWVRYSGTYVVPANQPTTQLSFAALTVAGGDDTMGNFLDDVTFGSSPCMRATSTVSNASPANAQTVTYSTTVANTGGSPAAGVSFSWDIPSGLTYVANSLRINGVVGGTVNGASVFAPLGAGATATAGGSLATGISASVTFDVVVTAQQSTTLAYTPRISHSNMLAPGWVRTGMPANVPLVVSAPRADLGVTATVSAQTVARSRAVMWSFGVTNAGPSASSGVVVRISVPSGLTAVTPAGPSAACTTVSGVAGTYDCSLSGALAVNATAVVTLTATAPANALTGDRYTVTAVARSSTTDPSSSNNTASATVVADATPPNPPTNLTASPGRTSITLGWRAPQYGSTDVAAYVVYRNGTYVGMTAAPSLSYTDSGLAGNTAYDYQVFSYDAAGNLSSTSIGGRAQTN